MRYIHQIVTIGDRDVTSVESIYTNSSTPKMSFKLCLQIMTDVQYEIYDRETKEIRVIN